MWYYLLALIPIAILIKLLVASVRRNAMDKKVHTEFLLFIKKEEELEEALSFPMSADNKLKCEVLEAEANAHFKLYLKYLDEKTLKLK